MGDWNESQYREITTPEEKAAGQKIIEFRAGRPRHAGEGFKYYVEPNTGVTKVMNIPDNAEVFSCEDNKLSTLPNLPENLEWIHCNNNLITSLPPLPKKLQLLEVYNNQLTSLPDLPPDLETLQCSDNRLTSIPKLPTRLTELSCSNNKLTTLPELPELRQLDFANNLILPSVIPQGSPTTNPDLLPANFPQLPTKKLRGMDPGQNFIDFFKELLGDKYPPIDAFYKANKALGSPELDTFVGVVNKYLSKRQTDRFQMAVRNVPGDKPLARMATDYAPLGNEFKKYFGGSSRRKKTRSARKRRKTIRRKRSGY
jgi:hypothetical protein